jgi:hypothetical protein
LEVTTMTQESALTREEIEALDRDLDTLGFDPGQPRQDSDQELDQQRVRAREPEARS